MDRRHVCNDAILMRPCVYILASQRNGTLYVGVQRPWKIALIEEANPGWQDLYETAIA
jgi:predicted GIY-YIG superfamily endonuclease